MTGGGRAAGGRRVLVAEDDAALGALLVEVLRQEFGADVEVVADGVAAVVALGRGAYAVAVLDLFLPRMDGFAVLRWLAARPPDGRVPVVVCAAGSDGHLAEALHLGAAACVAKPFDLDDLAAAVRPFLTARPREIAG